MSDNLILMINDFLIIDHKYKLIIHHGLKGLDSCDLGFELSQAILQVHDEKNFSFKAKELLDKICANHIAEHSEFGKYLSLKNSGILFHNELKLDINAFIKKFSLLHPLFLEWEGLSTNNELFFLTQRNGQRVHIGDITHLNLTNT